MNPEDKFDAEKFSRDLHDRIHRDVHGRIEDDVDRFRKAARRRAAQVHLGNKSAGMWTGGILVIIGTAFLLNNMGILPADRLWRFWPLILILAGAARFTDACHRVVGIIMMLFGSLFLLNNLGYLHFSWGEVWPVVIIAVGVSIIWGRVANRPPAALRGNLTDPNNPTNPNVVNATTVFGGVERRITTTSLTGGTVTATFGGVNLDFRSADIEGEEAILYVEALFGGIELVIPDRWIVIYEGHSVFGGYVDETRPPLPDVPGAPPRKRLILRGQAMFGGITVKN